MRKSGCVIPVACCAFVLTGVVVGGGSGEFPASATASSLDADAAVPEEYRRLIEEAARHCARVDAPLLAAQIHAESGWDPRQVSSHGARGLAQFLEPPGPSGGGTRTATTVPPRTTRRNAIDAQARYLCFLVADLADVPGDPVENALAAYHAGPSAVREHVPPFAETRAYVERLLSLLPRYRARPGPGRAADCAFTLARPNPRTCQEAIEAARREARSGSLAWRRLCLAVAAEAYGWSASGEATANAAWNRMVASGLAHHGDTQPPAGALLSTTAATRRATSRCTWAAGRSRRTTSWRPGGSTSSPSAN
jgi:hypothetical protein